GGAAKRRRRGGFARRQRVPPPPPDCLSPPGRPYPFKLEQESAMTDRRMAFEDCREGDTFRLGTKTLTAEEIVDFAGQFDMQPMHLDEAAGKASILGGLSASGWHTCATFMRLMCDGFLLNSTSQGAPGVDYARWKRP